MGGPGGDPDGLAGRLIAALTERHLTVAVAESLTGGLIGATLTAVPGASLVFRGGVTAYTADLKASLLGVPPGLLSRQGTVARPVAEAMADGVRQRLGADLGVAATGVAGPGDSEGKAPGTVHISVGSRAGHWARELALAGSREEVRRATVAECLGLLWTAVMEQPS